MHYLIGRDLDGDGRYEFIQDMDRMILTDDPARALQVTENELDYLDMSYLNQAGFYALEADRFQVSLLEALLFHPVVHGYRPCVPPPPRRRPPKPRGLFGIFAPPPKPRRAPRAPKPPRPSHAPHGFGGPGPHGPMGGPGPHHEGPGGHRAPHPGGGRGKPGGGRGR